jgi:hypothetical protein
MNIPVPGSVLWKKIEEIVLKLNIIFKALNRWIDSGNLLGCYKTMSR